MAIIISAGTGDWDAGATWVGGAAPTTNQDDVVIAAGHTVTGNADFACRILGTLEVEATGVLNMDSTHSLTFHSTGEITIEGTLDFAGDQAYNGAWFGAGGISSAGDVGFDGGVDWSGYTGTLTLDPLAPKTINTSGVAGPKIAINTASSVTVDTSAPTFASFTHTSAGTYIDSGLAHSIAGDINYDGSGTMTTTGTWTMTASGDFRWSSVPNQLREFIVPAGVTATRIGAASYVRKLRVAAGATMDGNQILSIYIPVTHDFFEFLGTAAEGHFESRISGNFTNNYSVLLGTRNLGKMQGSNNTWTQTQPFSCGALRVYGRAIGTYGKMAFTSSYTIGALTFGLTDADQRKGMVDFGSGSGSVASIARNADSVGNEVDSGESQLNCSGTIDGTGITWTGGTGRVIGGTISNLTVAGHRLLALSCANGGSNSGVNFGVPSTAPSVSV